MKIYMRFLIWWCDFVMGGFGHICGCEDLCDFGVEHFEPLC